MTDKESISGTKKGGIWLETSWTPRKLSWSSWGEGGGCYGTVTTYLRSIL